MGPTEVLKWKKGRDRTYGAFRFIFVLITLEFERFFCF